MTEQELLNHFLSMAIEHKHFRQIRHAIDLGAHITALHDPLRNVIKAGDTDTLVQLIDMGVTPQIRDLQYFVKLNKEQMNSAAVLSCLLTAEVVRDIQDHEKIIFYEFGLMQKLIENYPSDIIMQFLRTALQGYTFCSESMTMLFARIEKCAAVQHTKFLDVFDCVIGFLLDSKTLETSAPLFTPEQSNFIQSVIMIGANKAQFEACCKIGLFSTHTHEESLEGVRDPSMLAHYKAKGMEPTFTENWPYPFMREEEYHHLGCDITLCNQSIKTTSISKTSQALPMLQHVIEMIFHHVAIFKETACIEDLLDIFAPYKDYSLENYLFRVFANSDYTVPRDKSAYSAYDGLMAKLAVRYNLSRHAMDWGAVCAVILSSGAIPRNIYNFVSNTFDSKDKEDYFRELMSLMYARKFVKHPVALRAFILQLTDEDRALFERNAYQQLQYTQKKTINQLCAGYNKASKGTTNHVFIKMLLLSTHPDKIMAAIPKVRTYDTMTLLLTLIDMTPMEALSSDKVELNAHQRNLVLQALSGGQ